MKRILAILFALAALACLPAVLLRPAQGQPAQQSFTNTDILSLWSQGFSEGFLVNVIQQNQGRYLLGPDDLRTLNNARVPVKVVEAMSAKMGGSPAFAANLGSPAPALAAPAVSSGGSNPAWPSVASDTTISFHPDGQATWTAMVAERVTWSREGVTKIVRKVASAGIAGRPLTGTLSGPASLSVLSNPPEFVMDLPLGANPNNWVLVPLETRRKTRTVTDPMHQALMIHVVDRRANQFKMRSDNELAPGEYGLVNMSTVSDERPTGSIYAFRLR